MITKERLEELIKQEEMVWYKTNYKSIKPLKLYKNVKPNDKFLFSKQHKNGDIPNYYETKEEAEFVAKNHDTRIEKFEPPFGLPLYERYEFMSKYLGNVFVNHNEDCYYVCASGFYAMHYFDTYQEAVDYARKLFNGEE